MKLAYKIHCLSLTRTKEEWLNSQIQEYANIYNYAARFIPSLPEKYFKFKQPSKLYTKWIKGGKVERKVIQAQSAFCAIADAVANYKSSERYTFIEKPNIIKFGNNGYKFIKNKDHYGIIVGGKKGIFIPLRIGKKQDEVKELLDYVITTNKNVGIITYNFRNNSISISHTVESEHKFLKKGEIKTIIGVDRGINNHVVLSAVDKKTKKVLGIKIISGMEDRDRMRHLKKIANKRRESKKEVGNKIRNIQDTNAHRISRAIVNFTTQFNNPVMIFEDLKSMKKNRLRKKYGGKAKKGQRKMVASWNYADLKTKTDYKLKEKGIWTFEVRAWMTSQYCHRCGAIGIRDGIHFHCENCGLGCGSTPQSTVGQYNADVNASINIALRGIHVLYGREPDTVAVSNGQPDDSTTSPIPTEMNGAGRYNSKSNRLDKTNARIENGGSLAVSDQPNAQVSVAGGAPENDLYSSLFKGNDKNAGRIEPEEQNAIREVLSQSKF